jgi:DNA-binding response OmpR family regulator
MQILIVEDDPDIASLLTDYLQAHGHHTDWASSGPRALTRLEENRFDAILLDRGLPRMEGLRFLQIIRHDLQLTTPVLVLTAKDSEAEKLEGFQAGADDYVVKPFSLAEVEARIKAITRRHNAAPSTTLHVGNLIFDTARYTLSLLSQNISQPLNAGPKTLQLIEIFMREPDHIFSHQKLEQALWHEPQPNSDRLRQTLYQARKLIETEGSGCQIKTIHSLGYRLEVTT